MIALTTERLSCTLITPADWPFFLMLQQHPQVTVVVDEAAASRLTRSDARHS